jgi:hypothetical protein
MKSYTALILPMMEFPALPKGEMLFRPLETITDPLVGSPEEPGLASESVWPSLFQMEKETINVIRDIQAGLFRISRREWDVYWRHRLLSS